MDLAPYARALRKARARCPAVGRRGGPEVALPCADARLHCEPWHGPAAARRTRRRRRNANAPNTIPVRGTTAGPSALFGVVCSYFLRWVLPLGWVLENIECVFAHQRSFIFLTGTRMRVHKPGAFIRQCEAGDRGLGSHQAPPGGRAPPTASGVYYCTQVIKMVTVQPQTN